MKTKSGDVTLEMMEAILCSYLYVSSQNEDEDYRDLSVEQLRTRLFKEGIFDLDGSREMLIAQLREQKIIERGCSTI